MNATVEIPLDSALVVGCVLTAIVGIIALAALTPLLIASWAEYFEKENVDK